MPLTDVVVRNAKVKGAAYRMRDAGGLYLLVSSTGGKSWRWNYRYAAQQKTMTFGKYPDVSLAGARSAHQTARTELAKGNDPMAQRKATKTAAKAQAAAERTGTANSFRSVALKWHEWWAPGVDSGTAAYILRRLEADVFPVFGNKSIKDITPAEIRELITAIERGEGKGRRFEGRGARDVAQRQHGTIGQIYRYAVVHDLADMNPASAFKPGDVLKPRKTQNRAHIGPQELPTLLMAMEDYAGQTVVKLGLKLMALTFVRTQELLGAPWSEFDLNGEVWKIDPDRMKKERPHIVPLSRQAISILRHLKEMAGEKRFVFPGLNTQTADGNINCNSLLNALADLGYKGVMTGHGYRGLARTVLAEHNFDKAHVELQLSHANDDKTDAAYNHALYLPQRKELMQWWADFLDSELTKRNAGEKTIRLSTQADTGTLDRTKSASSNV